MRAPRSDGARDEAAHVALAIERDRGPEIELGAMGEEISRYVLAHAREASGPAEHADLVVVALADDIGARFDQELDDVQIGSVRGKVQGVGVVVVVADANVGAAIEEEPHAGRAIAPSRHMQRRPSPEVAAAGIDQIEMGIKQPAELVCAALLRGLENGADRLLHCGGTIAAHLEIAGHKLDRRVAAGLADLVDGATVFVGETRIESALEGAANGLDIAGARRGEHALAGDLVDMGLERPPLAKP